MRQLPSPAAVGPLRGCTGLPDYERGSRPGPDGRIYEGWFERRLCATDSAQLGPDEYHWSPDEPLDGQCPQSVPQ